MSFKYFSKSVTTDSGVTCDMWTDQAIPMVMTVLTRFTSSHCTEPAYSRSVYTGSKEVQGKAEFNAICGSILTEGVASYEELLKDNGLL